MVLEERVLRGGGDSGGDPFEQDPSVQRAHTPLWREAFFPLDWLALRLSPVYFGFGVPRGRGEPVVVIPGFLGSDAYLFEFYCWLQRIGYRPYFSQIGVNADCPDHLAGLLVDTVKAAREETGIVPRLVGHSLGGMLARTVALEYPSHVAGLITLGSPFRDSVRAHPTVLAAAESLRRMRRRGPIGRNIRPSCFSGHCTCTFVRNMLAPGEFAMPHFAIFSKTDGVVEWESCVEDDPALNTEVCATHVGMAFHPAVYMTVAKRLAEIRAAEKVAVASGA
jgi:pimeloyl-ACP methyl ester carboxylesterase